MTALMFVAVFSIGVVCGVAALLAYGACMATPHYDDPVSWDRADDSLDEQKRG